MLLLDDSSHRLFAYNDTARHVWDLIEAGLTEDAITLDFGRVWDIPLSVARRDIDSILAQWRAQGVLDADEIRIAPKTLANETAPAPDRASPPRRWASEWTCTIERKTMAFAIENELLAPIRLMLAHLESPGAQAQVRIEIRNAPDGDMALVSDGRERFRTSDDGVLVGGLWQAILEHIHPEVRWLALIHGAAVARAGQGIALCGPSGSGKSTLTAALTSGGFDYLADDLVAVAAPDGTIMPWPAALSLKCGSFDVVARYRSDLAQAQAYRTKGVEARLLAPPRTALDVAVPLRRLVFPRFTSGAAAELQRLSTFAAIERLLADRLWIGYPITADCVAALLMFLCETPAYAVSYGNLDDAIRLIEDMT